MLWLAVLLLCSAALPTTLADGQQHVQSKTSAVEMLQIVMQHLDPQTVAAGEHVPRLN